MLRILPFLFAGLSTILVPGASLAQSADLVFVNGPVLTMSDPPVAEALAVDGETILAVGDEAEVLAHRDDDTRVVDLQGRALLPGFIDAHGHLAFSARIVSNPYLAPPPAGNVSSIAELRAELQAFVGRADLDPEDPVVGFGYDDSLLAERRHPTADDLDDLFPDRAVLLRHVSGHLMAVNTKALELAGLDGDSEDPPGGHIRRRQDGRSPNGVLEESAMGAVAGLVPLPSHDERLRELDDAQRVYAGYGITTAQDGYTSAPDLDLYIAAADEGRLILDVVAYPNGRTFDSERVRPLVERWNDRLKVAGVKLSLDGSPQGKTAYLTEPFHVPPPGKEATYRGYPSMQQPEVDRRIGEFVAAGVKMLVHANGDAAGDQLLHALETARRRDGLGDHRTVRDGLGDHRTVMIHAQITREDQLDRIADLGVVPSFFVAHTFYWGDWHRDSVLGAHRAERISAAASALRRGIVFTFHNDAPIVPPDMMRLVWTGVNRRTRSGDILGATQRVSATDALRAVTIHAAYQSFDEARKGSLEVGKQADMVVLARNPLEVDPSELHAVEIDETFSRGRSIHSR